MSTESYVTVPPDSAGKRLRALNYTLSGQNAAQSVWSEVINIGDPQSGAYLALVNASGALSVSASGDAVSISGNVVGVYAASQQSGWMAVISGVGATSGQVQVASSGLGTVAVSSGSVIPVMAASFQSGGSVAVSGVGATSGQLNVASSGFGTVAIASGGIIPISIISGNVVALSGIVEIVSGQTVTAVSSGIGTVAVSSGGVIPTILASAQSGGLVGISGGGLTISGGVTVSGSVVVSGVGNTSGQLNIASSGYGTVAVASGGVLPISLVSGSVGALSGLVGVSISGALGATISGGVTISGLVGISGGGLTVSGGVTVSGSVMVSGVGNTSGQLNVASSGLGTVAVSSGGTLPVGLTGYQSGVLVGISGGSVGLSGLQGVAISGSVTVLPNAYQSGQLVALSGGGAGISGVAVQVFTSGGQNVIIATSGGAAIKSDTNALAVSLWQSTSEATISNYNADGISNPGTSQIGVAALGLSFGGGAFDRTRTIAGSSGILGALGIQAVLPAPWTYSHISGGVTTNIWQSGAVFVHGININSYSSGGSITVRDSQSGAAGTIVGVINPDAGSLANVALAPTTINYDAVFVTGLVITTANANWDLTVFYRGLLS